MTHSPISLLLAACVMLTCSPFVIAQQADKERITCDVGQKILEGRCVKETIADKRAQNRIEPTVPGSYADLRKPPVHDGKGEITPESEKKKPKQSTPEPKPPVGDPPKTPVLLPICKAGEIVVDGKCVPAVTSMPMPQKRGAAGNAPGQPAHTP